MMDIGLSPSLAILNNDTIHIGVQISFQVPAFNYFRHKPRSGIDHMVILCLTLRGTVKLFLQELQYFIFTPAIHEGSNFSTILAIFHFLKIIITLMNVIFD